MRKTAVRHGPLEDATFIFELRSAVVINLFLIPLSALYENYKHYQVLGKLTFCRAIPTVLVLHLLAYWGQGFKPFLLNLRAFAPNVGNI
jgi:hypothetical protein